MYTRASLAMGYEFGVTPVQLAAAYAAIANDGMLLAPTLVREVRDPAGEVLYRHQPEPVRRVVTRPRSPRSCASSCGKRSGEGGTGEQAQLVNYSVLGKTGTAVRFEDGHYVRGEYTASFAAIFPADDPQLVVIVKIDNPQGQLLRRTHCRAGHPDDAAAGAGLAPGGDRPRPPRRAATAAPATRGAGRTPAAGRPPVVGLAAVPSPADRSPRARPVPDVAGRSDPRGRARAAPARVPGEPARARAGRADGARGGRERAAGDARWWCWAE